MNKCESKHAGIWNNRADSTDVQKNKTKVFGGIN